MTPRNAAEIALGVIGVWLIVSRVPELGVTVAFYVREPDESIPWFLVVHLGLVIVCGLGLWLLRHRIASWLVPEPQADLSDSVAGLQAAAFSVIGLFMLAEGLAGLLAQLITSVTDVGGSLNGGFAGPLAKIAVGLPLFLGARGLATIWQSLRTAGLPRGDRGAGAA
jgi:hypothetical protein